eukprot:1408367-Rhodomonas_salina.1
MSGRTAAGVVGDVFQTHGFVGKGKDAGEWGKLCPRRIKERAGEKNSTYGHYTFASCTQWTWAQGTPVPLSSPQPNADPGGRIPQGTLPPFQQDQNLEFVPLIGDTRGNLCITSVAMFQAAEVAFAAREQTIMVGRSYTKAFYQQR